jgi:hypothetical protein
MRYGKDPSSVQRGRTYHVNVKQTYVLLPFTVNVDVFMTENILSPVYGIYISTDLKA